MTITGRGTVATGRVERGIAKVGDTVEIVGLMEKPRSTVITGLEMFRKTLDSAEAGDNVGALLRGVQRNDIERGQVLAKPGSIHPHTHFMAVYNPRSQIALRILSRREEPINRAFITARVHRALEYRRAFADLRSCRLLFAESDGLPAVIADAFDDVIVLQVLCLGMEAFKQDIVDALVSELHPRGVFERNDVPVRTLEGLPMQTGLLYGDVPARVEMVENGVHFWVDVKEGQKTGFFLDQKENRAAIAPFAKGARVLDCFTHTGSFALHAARYGAAEVTGVDISEYACDFATENATLNGFEDRVRFVCANAFDYLRAAQDRHELFDLVVLDPPAFTKTRSAVPGALRGYKEINLRGMKLVRDGGYLVTCSWKSACSRGFHTGRAGGPSAVRGAHRCVVP